MSLTQWHRHEKEATKVAHPAEKPHPSRCFILELPIELLDIILHSIPRFDIVYYKPNPQSHATPNQQLVILLHTCRTFRRLLHGAHFWLAPQFNFYDLLPPSPSTVVYKRITAFLADEYFANCLKRKREWGFHDKSTLKAVAMSLPSFRTLATSVRWDWDPGMEMVLDEFECCATIVDIMDREAGADLDGIEAAFPKVRDLVVRRGGERHPSPIIGSLDSLEYLERLTIVSSSIGSGFTPWDSLHRSTSLTLHDVSGDITLPLEAFTAVREADLWVNGKNPGDEFDGITKWLLRILKLVILNHRLGLDLSGSLREWRAHKSWGPWDLGQVGKILETVSRLRDLERLEVTATPDPRGARFLSQLKKLKVLVWKVDLRIWEAEWEDDFSIAGEDFDLFEDDPKGFLEKVFSQFEKMPDISVEIIE
jgi:hypothetical protein